MALPDYLKASQGTAVIWGESGASGVTKTLTLDALANAAGRMGASADLSATWDQDYLVYLYIETGTAPTAGNTVELYMACSYDNSVWPGKVTGSDAAYPTTVANNKLQLELVQVLVATGDSNTTLVQAPTLWRPKGRYVTPVVVNLLGQAIRNETTDSDNDSRVILVPYKSSIED